MIRTILESLMGSLDHSKSIMCPVNPSKNIILLSNDSWTSQ